jgi:hypothetical protein
MSRFTSRDMKIRRLEVKRLSNVFRVVHGGRGRNRTYNLSIKSRMLCQLSYASRRATAGATKTAAREHHRFSYITQLLEGEGDAARDRAVSLCKEQRATVRGHKGAVPLRQQVAHVEYRLRVPRQDATDSDWLAQQNTEV